MNFEQKFTEAILKKSIPEVIDVFKSLSTDHASTPKQSVKYRALQIIRELNQKDSSQIYNIGIDFSNSADITCEELSLILLAENYQVNPADVTRILHKLSNSTNWEIREWAASACSIVLSNHFFDFLNILKQWVRDDSANVRRCVAVAVKYVSKQKKDEFFTGLVELIEPLLFDKDPYVKKNLGAFAIGDGLLKYYPKEMLGKITEWVQIDNEQVRSQIALIFTSAVAASHYEKLEDIFHQLKEDHRVEVQKAVKQAEKNLTKRLKL